MQKMQMIKGGLAVSATLSMLVACGPAPNTGSSPSPTATPTASAPVATPTPAATPTPVQTTSPAPTATPTATASASASPSASPTASSSASAGPTAAPTSDISVVEKTTLNGKVYDDTNAPLDGVSVTAKSLNSSVPFEATATTAGGSYAFNNAPSGVTIEISATRPGYTSRRRVEVLKSNKTGDPNANRYDFGTDGSTTLFGTNFNALSDRPEVTNVTPGRNASGVSANTSFVLKFSEPMDRATVQDALEVIGASTKTFTVDPVGPTVTGNTTVTVAGDKTVAASALAGSRVWDKAAFNISWNSDDTEATFTFKEERQLPTDKDSDKTPDYKVELSKSGPGTGIKDKSGVTRDDNPVGSATADQAGKFKLTDGSFEKGYKFAIATDSKKPFLDGLVAQTAENSGTNGDALKVHYSERMIHYTLSKNIAGGMGNTGFRTQEAPAAVDGTSASAAAINYNVTVARGSVTVINKVKWSALGGTAVFDTNDPTHHTVLLLPRTALTVAGTLNATAATATYTYSDGTTETVATGAAGANTAAALQTALQAQLATGTYNVTFINDTGTAGTFDAGDTYFVGLTAGATRGGKTITAVNFANTGAFAVGAGNANNVAQILVSPANTPTSAGANSVNIYVPGDNITVNVDSTVLDPAGNSIDTGSNNNQTSANAS